ncbi:MAG: Integral membrane protein TerC, partial [uncultured Acidimicrobiales bacterium]
GHGYRRRRVQRDPTPPPGCRGLGQGQLRQLRGPVVGVGRAHRGDRRDARHRPPARAQDRPRHLDQGGVDRVRHLDLDRARLRPRDALLARRAGGRRVLRRLPDREEPLDRQRLRVGGDLLVLRSPPAVPVQGPVLGHLRGPRAACHLHLRRRLPDRALRVGPLHLRRLPALHGGQDRQARREPRRRLQQQHRHEGGAQAVPDDGPVRRPEALHRRERQARGDPVVRSARPHRGHRRGLRRRLRARHPGREPGAVHRVRLERVRHPRPAVALLPPRRDAGQVPVPQHRPGRHPRLRRHQDAPHRRALRDPPAHPGVAQCDLRCPPGGDRRLPPSRQAGSRPWHRPPGRPAGDRCARRRAARWGGPGPDEQRPGAV